MVRHETQSNPVASNEVPGVLASAFVLENVKNSSLSSFIKRNIQIENHVKAAAFRAATEPPPQQFDLNKLHSFGNLTKHFNTKL